MPFLEGGQIAGLVVGSAVHPAPMEDADPLECECPQGGVSRRALGPVALVERAGSEGARGRLGSPFDEGLAEELGAGVAPMNDARVAAALGHRSDARISLQC